MPWQPLRSLLFLILASSLLIACGNSRRGGALPDSSLLPADAGDDGGMTFPDSGAPFDSGTARDSAAPVDSGRPVDSGTPVDSGRPDSGTPVMDSGTSPTDSGLPSLDGGLPLGDAGICIAGALPCPAGQVCCEILPGIGYGMCAASCP